MTYLDCEKLYHFHLKNECDKNTEIIRNIAIYIAQGAFVGNHGNKNSLKSYISGLQRHSSVEEDNDIDSQFQGVDFGK